MGRELGRETTREGGGRREEGNAFFKEAIVKHFPATKILPITAFVFSEWYRDKAFMRKTLPIGRVY